MKGTGRMTARCTVQVKGSIKIVCSSEDYVIVQGLCDCTRILVIA